MPTPATVIQALATPDFWRSNEFWGLCQYVFTQHEGQLVWKSLKPESMRQLMLNLSMRLEACHQDNPKPVALIDPVYFLVLEKVRGQRTNQEFHGGESAAFLAAMYNVYQYLRAYSSKGMPNFGDMRASV